MTNNTLPAALLAALLAGCAAPQLPPPSPMLPLAPQPVVPAPAQLAWSDETAPLLAYHQQLRRMSTGELLAELANLAQRQPTPRITLQTGMALLWTRGAGDLARAQALFDSVASNSGHPLAPLAALLSAQCGEQRRLLEHGDRLAAQLKESQRRNEQLSETLESLKTIERNLPARTVPTSQQAQGAHHERQR